MKMVILIITSVFAMNLSGYAQDDLVFSKPDDPVANISEEILKEAYQKIGIRISTTTFPAERAIRMSNSGRRDGEVNRVKGLDERYPSLVMVPVEINILEGVVFTTNVSFPVTGWESLRPYNIGIRIGTKFAETGTAGMDVDKVPKNIQLFKKLSAGRNDIVVTSRLEGLWEIKKLGLKNIRILEPPLMKLSLYHYLHKKHIKLVPEIEKILKKMKQEGRILTIRKNFISKLSEKKDK
ncbi:MAG: transporter substrate-binding domain-containing protein [Desulfobacterales bacterium]|nr:transporter substrate-binding domain-containing protein [Desulfobacterales bacterium]